jgi:allophanate hydrolase subunit 1
MKCDLIDGGFAFLPNNPGATPITRVVATERSATNHMAVTFGDKYGATFSVYFTPGDWQSVCDTVAVEQPYPADFLRHFNAERVTQ